MIRIMTIGDTKKAAFASAVVTLTLQLSGYALLFWLDWRIGLGVLLINSSIEFFEAAEKNGAVK